MLQGRQRCRGKYGVRGDRGAFRPAVLGGLHLQGRVGLDLDLGQRRAHAVHLQLLRTGRSDVGAAVLPGAAGLRWAGYPLAEADSHIGEGDEGDK